MRRMTLAIVVSLVVASIAATTAAAPILQVDFGGNFRQYNSGTAANQSGWSDFNDLWEPYLATVSHTYGSYTVRVTEYVGDDALNGAAYGQTFGGGVTLTNLYNDALENWEWSSGTPMKIKVEGLAAGQKYAVDVWHWGGPSGSISNQTWYDITSGSDVLIGTYSSSAAQPTGDSDYKDSFNVTSSAGGVLEFRVTTVSGGLFAVNGIALSESGTVVPEPGTLLLLGTGALGMIGWMRRRSMR